MARQARVEAVRTVARHLLLVVSEGPSEWPAPRAAGVLAVVVPGALGLDCAGNDIRATVIVERHDGTPPVPDPEWQVVAETEWEVPSGRLGVTDPEGALEWLPDLGLHPGTWHVRLAVSGRAGAEEVEDALDEEIASDEFDIWAEPPLGPERWLVQLWP